MGGEPAERGKGGFVTENEAQVLGEIDNAMSMAPGAVNHADPQWHRPMDVSSILRGDHVAKLLRRMSLHPNGWVEAQARSPGWATSRGSYVYRITAKGKLALANHLTSKRAAEGVKAVERSRRDAIMKALKGDDHG